MSSKYVNDSAQTLLQLRRYPILIRHLWVNHQKGLVHVKQRSCASLDRNFFLLFQVFSSLCLYYITVIPRMMMLAAVVPYQSLENDFSLSDYQFLAS